MSISCSFQRNLSARRWKFPQSLKYLSNFNYKPPKPEYQQTARTLSKSAKTLPLLQRTQCVWGCVCLRINTHPWLHMCIHRHQYHSVIQHVSRVLKGGSARRSSGGIRMMMIFSIIYQTCVKTIKTLVPFSGHILGFILYTHTVTHM